VTAHTHLTRASRQVGKNLIVHAGVLPHHLDSEGGLEGLNTRTWEWLANLK
jgi:hypothetical protein